MPKRKNYQIKENILLLLKDKPLSYTQIQTKLSTNYDTVKNNCKELEFYDFINIKKIKKHPKNGKPSHYISITNRGIEIINKKKNLEG